MLQVALLATRHARARYCATRNSMPRLMCMHTQFIVEFRATISCASLYATWHQCVWGNACLLHIVVVGKPQGNLDLAVLT